MLGVYGAAFFLALAGGFVFIPFSIWLAKKLNVIDQPDLRKVHAVPVPRWGGLGIALSLFFSLAVLIFFSDKFDSLLNFQHRLFNGRDVVGVLSVKKQLLGILFGSLFVLGLGM